MFEEYLDEMALNDIIDQHEECEQYEGIDFSILEHDAEE